MPKLAKRQLGMIKRTLFKASEKARLLACRPDVEYAAAVWDPNLEYITHDIGLVQHNISIRKFRSRNSGC